MTRLVLTPASSTLLPQVVEETLGKTALNSFCREIVRGALMYAAGLTEVGEREHSADGLFADLLAKAALPETKVPQAIEIKRGVSMMMMRLSQKGSERHAQGASLLREAAEMALRFYGERSLVLADMERSLAEC